MNFLFNELQNLQAIEGKTLDTVIYQIWRNRANPAQPFDFIDKIELILKDGPSVMLGVSEEALGITVNQQGDDTEKLKQDLLSEFNGRITMHVVPMNATELWNPAIYQVIANVKLEKLSNGTYSNEAILLEFANRYFIEIRYHDDGLIAELYEDV